MFLKKEEEGGRTEEGGSLGETLAPPFAKVFKTDSIKYLYNL
jgi:hypothetical protein